MATTMSGLSEDPTNQYARSVTVWNDAGGVGKTTVTENVSAVLGRNDRKVLAIDLDPQAGGLTHHTGFEACLSRPKYNITDILLNDNRTLNDVIINGKEFGMDFDLIPAHEELSDFPTDVTINLGPKENSMLLLRNGLVEAGLPAEYDMILIDAPATRGKLVENAIAATRNVLIPTESSPKGLASVDGLYSYVSDRQRLLRNSTGDNDITLSVIAVVPNAGAKNGQFGKTEGKIFKELHDNDDYDMVPFHIPERNLIDDAWYERESIPEFVENKRDLRPAEEEIPKMFEMLGVVVEQGTVDAIKSYDGNLPSFITEGGDDE